MKDTPTTDDKPSKHPGGRPTKLTPKLLQKAQSYVDDCKDQVEHFEGQKTHWEVWRIKLPTIEGLARHLRIARSTLYLWQKESTRFSDIIEDLQTEQADRLINQGLSGNYNSTIAKVLLAKHGYVEKQELTGADGAPLMPIGLDAAILARRSNGKTPPSATKDSGERS